MSFDTEEEKHCMEEQIRTLKVSNYELVKVLRNMMASGQKPDNDFLEGLLRKYEYDTNYSGPRRITPEDLAELINDTLS